MFNILLKRLRSPIATLDNISPALTGLFFGDNGHEIYLTNERQVVFMLVTGFGFTHMTYKTTSNLWKTGGAFVATLIAAYCLYGVISPSKDKDGFSMVKKQPFKLTAYEFIFIYSITLLGMLWGINYMARVGFYHMACSIMPSEIAKAAAFVMTSLVMIYPSKCGDNKNAISGIEFVTSENANNVSTISGFAGVITFCIIATLIRYNVYSFSDPMVALKAIPIFFACMEAIYEEGYVVYTEKWTDNKNQKHNATVPSRAGTALNCLIGSAILTAGFIYADQIAKVTTECLASVIALSRTFATYNISIATVEHVAEIIIVPFVFIAVSAICRNVCNVIGEATGSNS